MIRKLNFILFILILIFIFASCSDDAASKDLDLSADINAVLDWQLTSEEIFSPEKASVLQVHSIGIPENALYHAAETFMNISNLIYTTSPPNTIEPPESFYCDKLIDYLFDANNEGNAIFSIAKKADEDVSFGLSFRTFENSYIRQTFILPDKDTIPSHTYTSDRFQQNVDLDFLSCEEAKTKTRDFLDNLGLPVDNLEFTIYTIDLKTLQTVADDMYAAGRFIDPSIDDPFWPEGKDHTVMYKQYAKEDECYYIIVQFTHDGIPLYDDEVGLSDGTSSRTIDKIEGPNPPFTMAGPVCHLLLDQKGFTYAQVSTGVCLNFEAEETPKTILTFQEAQKALASLYADQVTLKPDSVQKLELCYIPIYHEESKSFTLVPAWHAELYTYPDQERPDHIRVEQVFLDAYDGHQLYPPEEVPTDAAP